MAGDWIKMRKNLRTDRRVVAVAAALKLNADRVVGMLHAFWSVADENTEDGRLDGYTEKAVDAIAGVRGFAAALSRVGWLGIDERGVTIPDFGRHMGESAKARDRAAERQRMSRAKRDKSVTGGVTEAQQKCDNTVTRGRERGREREEISPSLPPKPPDSLASRAPCLPPCPSGDDAAACLDALHVDEPSRSQLLGAGITAEAIRAARDAIVAGDAEKLNRKPVGSLVAALRGRVGLRKGVQHIGPLVGAQGVAAQARLAQLRRQAGVTA